MSNKKGNVLEGSSLSNPQNTKSTYLTHTQPCFQFSNEKKKCFIQKIDILYDDYLQTPENVVGYVELMH